MRIDEIYQKGFLPLSSRNGLFYLTRSRSLRVNLKRFKDTSENRRIDRKVQELKIEPVLSKKSSFTNKADFKKFCLKYIRERFSAKKDKQWLNYLLKHNVLTHILTYRSRDKIYGYVFCCLTKNILHYWYVFFDAHYLRPYSLGKWLMWRTIHWAKDKKLKYVYLGTCYGKEGLYKARDHKGIEFFDGKKWNRDINLLKKLCHKDKT